MKRKPLLIFVFLTLLLLLGTASYRASAQGPATQQPTPPPPPPLNVQELFNLADQAKTEANAANDKANNVVNNANNAVNTVNLLLNFVQAASLFGGVLASVFAILGARVGSRTLSDYREELKKAQADLEEMHSGLNRETEQIRVQAAQSIRALALMQLGEQQLERRNIKGALQMYLQAYILDPDNGAINYFLGELYIQDKQLNKGIEHLQRALATDVGYAPAEAALGLALRLQADQATDPNQRTMLYAQAEERLLRAMQIDPNALDIHGESVQAALGALYKRQGRIDQAIGYYEEAHRIDPQKTYPVVNLASLYYRQGDVEKARPYFEEVMDMSNGALEVNPQDYWARLDRITAALVLGRQDLADIDLNTVLRQVTSPGPLETAVGELTRLKNSPTPLEIADPAISRMNTAISRLKGQSA